MADASPAPLQLDRLLKARSVAIVGASDKPGALGNQVLANLERHGFPGAIHLINPKRDAIGDRACLRSIEDLPDGVDAAVLAIPGAGVLPAVRALAARGVGAAVIFSAGFAEGGDEGLAAQREVARIAAAHGMVIEGPNCLGLVNYVDGVPLTFVETPAVRLGDRPGVGIVSQSGAMAVVLGTTLMAKELGLSISVSTGNEAASGVEDYLAYLLDDPATHAVAMIVEQFRAPRRFLELARAARAAGKPIVLLHPGKSSAARESAATHTGAMAGDWQVMKALVEHAGVVLVDGLEELGDVIDLAIRARPIGPGTAVLTESGAFKALALDLCEAIGLPLPAPAEATVATLRAGMPDFIGVTNPMDLTAQALVDPDLYRRTLAPLLDDPAYGSVVLGIIQTDEATSRLKFEPILDAIRALAPKKAVIFAGLDEGAPVPPAYVTALRALGVPYFPSPDRAFRALARLGTARAASAADERGLDPVEVALPHGGVIPEYRAKALLAPIGIRIPPGGFAADPAAAERIANEIGYPVVLKAQAQALSHKSDAGGVILGIADAAALADAWERLFANVAAYDPAVRLDGALVETMGARGLELIVGARNDPEWGPVLLVGFGGVQAEILRDVRLLPPDLTHGQIVSELRRLKSGALLDGWRGSPALDVDAAAETIAALGRLLRGTPAIREIDLNPVVVYPKGEGVVAFDALILVDEREGAE